MKKKICIVIVGVLVLLIAGCQMGAVSPENPLGITDPNQAIVWFEAGRQAATAGQAIGLATGNPAIIAGSTIALILIGAIGTTYLKKEKK